MSKNMIYLNLNKFSSESRKVYEIIIKGIFTHRIVRTTDDKVKLLEELVAKLPLEVVGDPRKIKVLTIVKLMNNIIADAHDNGELYYTTKKLYNNKNNKVSYTTGYFFYFKK